MAKVGDEVGGILQADGDADGAGLDAGALEFVARHIVMRSIDRQDDERFHAAKARGQSKKLHAVAESPRGGEAAFQIEGEHATKIAHLAARQFVIGMRRESRIMNARDLWMAFQKFRHRHRSFALALDAHAQRFHSANQQVRASRVHAAAKVNNVVAHAMDPRVRTGDGSGDQIRMSAEIFRRAVNDHVEAKRKRLLQHRAGERVVNNGDKLEFARDRDGAAQIQETQRGDRGRLNVKRAGSRRDDVLDAGEIRFQRGARESRSVETDRASGDTCRRKVAQSR